MKDKFYESAQEEQERFMDLLSKTDPLFAAKAAIFARHKFGMRSITHLTAAYIAKTVKGSNWARGFFERIVKRPDDALEILGAYKNINGSLHPIPNALKRGLSRALSKYSEYQIAKYKASSKDIKMVDAINLLHVSSEAIGKLITGNLKSPDTWEVAISKAGSESEKEWSRLIIEEKLGYFALLRNIRNIISKVKDENVLRTFFYQLTDENKIKNSLVFPFRYLSAIKAIYCETGRASTEARQAISMALDKCLGNLPDLGGETLVAVDCSGSMTCGKWNDSISYDETASLFAAALCKKSLADIIMFDSVARYLPINPSDSVLGIYQSMDFHGGPTDFSSIFRQANRKYDRIIIISDMQSWIGDTEKAFLEYKKTFKCSPHLYCWDVTGYGDTQFPENKVYNVSGISDKVFEIIPLLETNRYALISEINSVELS